MEFGLIIGCYLIVAKDISQIV